MTFGVPLFTKLLVGRDILRHLLVVSEREGSKHHPESDAVHDCHEVDELI